jgi:hypothetical protein
MEFLSDWACDSIQQTSQLALTGQDQFAELQFYLLNRFPTVDEHHPKQTFVARHLHTKQVRALDYDYEN